jgi:hypothetical protein
MTASTRATPTFTVHSASSTARAVFIAALCAFILTAFLVDVQHGATAREAASASEPRT